MIMSYAASAAHAARRHLAVTIMVSVAACGVIVPALAATSPSQHVGTGTSGISGTTGASDTWPQLGQPVASVIAPFVVPSAATYSGTTDGVAIYNLPAGSTLASADAWLAANTDPGSSYDGLSWFLETGNNIVGESITWCNSMGTNIGYATDAAQGTVSIEVYGPAYAPDKNSCSPEQPGPSR